MARPLGPEPAHGTRQRYQWRANPCRSGCCAEANARYKAGRAAAARLAAHRARPWVAQELPPEFLPTPPKRCGHSLMTMGGTCAWCGRIVDTTPDHVPGLVAA